MRQVKEYNVRRNEIIHAAQTLFFEKGYDAATIQDIIDRLNIAKGTFYHYFRSKNDLLDALVEQIITEMSQRLKPIVTAQKDAIAKINDIFRIGAAFKVENLDAFVIIVQTLYKDENQILRERMFQRSIKKYGPIISQIIKQGIEQGVFTTSYPDHVAEIMINLGRGINETICKTLLYDRTNTKTMTALLTEKMKMYYEVIERILGAPTDSITVHTPGEFEEIVEYFIEALHKDKNGFDQD